jgi:adenylate kinase
MTNSKPSTTLLFGSSGSGKGTQANLLTEALRGAAGGSDVLHIETGALFRDFIGNNRSYTSSLTTETLKGGGLLPVFLPVWIWTNYFVEHYTGNEHLILDGLARRYYEAPVLDSALRFYKRGDVHVIYLKTSYEWSREKLLSRGRGDDSPEEIKHRLDWFYENTIPAVNYFKNHASYTFHEIDGERSVEEVQADIQAAIGLVEPH